MSKNEEKKVAAPEDEKVAASQEVANAAPADETGINFEADAGAGFENVDASSMAIPFLIILQSGSPQVKKNNPKRIEGAEEGDILNTLSNEVYKGTDGVEVIPCHFDSCVIEWIHKDDGGGLAGIHPVDTPLLDEAVPDDKGKLTLPKGHPNAKDGKRHQLVLTHQHYVLFKDKDGNWQKGIIAMASSQLKKSKRWNSLMAAIKMTRKDGSKFTPPKYSHIYKLVTVGETKGDNSWSGWDIQVKEVVNKPAIYNEAKDFNITIEEMPSRIGSSEGSIKQLAAATGEDMPL